MIAELKKALVLEFRSVPRIGTDGRDEALRPCRCHRRFRMACCWTAAPCRSLHRLLPGRTGGCSTRVPVGKWLNSPVTIPRQVSVPRRQDGSCGVAAFGKEGALDVAGRGGAPVISGRSGSSERAAMAFLILLSLLKQDDHMEVSGKRWV